MRFCWTGSSRTLSYLEMVNVNKHAGYLVFNVWHDPMEVPQHPTWKADKVILDRPGICRSSCLSESPQWFCKPSQASCLGSGRSGGKVRRKTQMRNAEGNSGYLANKSRKLEGGIRGGAPTDRQTELKYQRWCGENYFSGTFWTVLLLLLLVVIVVVVLELLVL